MQKVCSCEPLRLTLRAKQCFSDTSRGDGLPVLQDVQVPIGLCRSGVPCGHPVGGGGGPGGAGAGSIKGTVSWTYSSLEEAPAGVIFFGAFDPNDNYYLVTITDGSQWLFPVTTGHYGTKLATGVQIQITVAP